MYICKAYDYTLKLHSTITLKKQKLKVDQDSGVTLYNHLNFH